MADNDAPTPPGRGATNSDRRGGGGRSRGARGRRRGRPQPQPLTGSALTIGTIALSLATFMNVLRHIHRECVDTAISGDLGCLT